MQTRSGRKNMMAAKHSREAELLRLDADFSDGRLGLILALDAL
jgi:hypothetical protein